MVCQASAHANSADVEHVCVMSGWVWRGESGTRGVQHSSVSVQLPLNLSNGRADLILKVEVPPELDPQHIPGQVESFQLSMPISVRSFRERVAPGGLIYQAAWQTRNGGPVGGNQVVVRQHAPAQHAVVAGVERCLEIEVCCTEDSCLEVEILLRDAQGCGAQDAEFEVTTSTFPALVGQVLVVGGRVMSADSRLVLQMQVRGADAGFQMQD